MTYDDPFKRLREQDEAILRTVNPLGLANVCQMSTLDRLAAQIGREVEEGRRLLDLTVNRSIPALDSAGLTSLADQASSHLKLLAGPMDSLHNLLTSRDNVRSLIDVAPLLRESLAPTLLAYKQYEQQFRLPELEEASRLAREALTDLTAIRRLCGLDASSAVLERAMQSMQTPWLLRDQVLESAQAFTQIQAIGSSINFRPPYEEALSAALRGDFGDWRGIQMFPQPIFANPVARSDFYVSLGFNSTLTNFTARAFDEITSFAGLGLLPREVHEGDEELGLKRTNAAHDQLQRFERHLRRFIDDSMTRAFGPSWVKQRTPAGMFDSWKKKRVAAAQRGEIEQPLIFYADFSDYVQIIERSDNWIEIFQNVFGRREDVKESFVRLFPIRNCTMHSRVITLDDELLLRVETRRILRAISLS